MSTQTNFQKFAKALAADPDFQTKLAAINDQPIQIQAEKLAEFASEVGVLISAEEFLHTLSDSFELSDEGLETVAGGTRSAFQPEGQILNWVREQWASDSDSNHVTPWSPRGLD